MSEFRFSRKDFFLTKQDEPNIKGKTEKWAISQ